ncbi:sensor histidine kinase [Methylophaga sp.]|uniref:sensor histidine kinase n=1 Tax=Methylophaga sp. TaxID=2024840 RepID=UPI00271ED3E4|nr:ATP-binding protein [Methylophaga sp.]MDO8826240.1 ATP-binding protein [Methylophaga sp.]
MLNIKRKHWPTIQEWLSQRLQFVTHNNKPKPALDLNDLAFKLATANDINETLPKVLKSLQALINEQFTETEQGDLLVLFSNPLTSETFLHHCMQEAPSQKLIQSLHQHFTIRKPLENNHINLQINGASLSCIPTRLFDYDNQTVWLLMSFRQNLPNEQKLKWEMALIEQTLGKGLQAWFQRESKVKQALAAERAIYAAELHDSLAQVLGYLKLKSAKLDKLCLKAEYAELKPITEDLAAYTQCAYHQTRELITASRLTMQSESLSQGVTNSVREFEQQSAIVFELDNRLPANLLPPKQSIQILYIIRESLSNIVRHSHATHARVALLLKTPNQLHIQIEDNGSGIDLTAARSDSFGLQIMHERAERVGAKLKISPRAEGGTLVKLEMDLGDKP